MKNSISVIELAKKLISIDSQRPIASESKVMQFIFDYLIDNGLKPEKQIYDKENDRFNILVFGSENATLMINVHMDTVSINDPNNWKHNSFGEIVDGKLYGRGSCDTKGHAACLLQAMIENFNENIVYVFNVEEELSMGGIKKVLELRKTRLKNLKYSISLEPTDGKIMRGNKGQYAFEVTAHGKTAHGSNPELGENAIYKIIGAARKIENYNKTVSKITHPLFGHATANLGVIGGGTASNVIPDYAFMCVDRRVLPNENPKDVEAEFRKLVAPLEVKFINRVEACETPADSKIVTEISKLLGNLGMDSNSYGFTATSELSELRAVGLEGIIFGTGELTQAHKPDEYITIKELEQCTTVLNNLLKRWK
ncbi:MAG: M20 family metallopeptidase [Candidatus Micrarchaeota archaeon]|nr:M20 family metallopeptidase [Candidatus Micrarchaeota archaeon]